MTNINNLDDSNIYKSRRNCIKQWFFQDSNELDPDFKNNMLVVATLIVAVTFQTGINPPGGAWQETKEGHQAGRAILSSLHHHVPYNLFLILNTLAFSMSTQIVLMLVYNRRLYFEVVVATISMVATYGMAIWSLSPKNDVKLSYVCLAALFPYLWRLSYQTFKTFIMNKTAK
ncbi:hypothetical protein LWI28_020785 [Acer negundo]|uniref:PGG domain-containing protein n=1 Tax=Acer negundo TaxID=4023 RepID=A0AAD5NTQ5_ACENE|nr:hypothetical protein LWI28_020785 [Acer negundo]KAK4848284.1 hypothetical protein QYF36_011246 [Acer negundo]